MDLKPSLLWILVPVFCLLTSCAPHSTPPLRLTVLDVGQGDCLLLETPSGHTMLIDGGGSNDEIAGDPRHVGLKTVVPYLRYRGINKIDVVVLTHPHSDHVGGLPDVIREEQVGAVLDGTTLPYPTPSYTAFVSAVRARHVPYRRAAYGTHIDFQDAVTVDVINPPKSALPYGKETDNDTVNDYSAVLRVTYGRTHFLLDGDAETDAEAQMLTSGADVTADVLKCGHHGAANATSDSWLTRVHPKYAAISCGRHNVFHHPNVGTLARLKAHGVQVFRTDQDGAVVFESDGKTVTAKGTILH